MLMHAQPRPSIQIDQRPYTHNLMPGADEPTRVMYSGRYYVHLQERGPFVVNVDSGPFRMDSGAGIVFCATGTCYATPHVYYHGDCKQTANALAASPGTAKWVITVGTPPPSCNEGCKVPWRLVNGDWVCDSAIPEHPKLMVWRIDPPGFRWWGYAPAPSVTDTIAVYPTLDGDFAYLQQKRFGTPLYTKIDLNTLSVVAQDLPSRPAWTPQATVDGLTYAMTVNANQPPGYSQPVLYTLMRSGVMSPTQTPAPPPPTPTPGPDPAALYIEALYACEITAGCGNGNFCPDRPMTRREVAVWLVKAMGLDLGTCKNVFHDVPCAP
jgi:hypothetical protein